MKNSEFWFRVAPAGLNMIRLKGLLATVAFLRKYDIMNIQDNIIITPE